jgi:hypothetical protein
VSLQAQVAGERRGELPGEFTRTVSDHDLAEEALAAGVTGGRSPDDDDLTERVGVVGAARAALIVTRHAASSH